MVLLIGSSDPSVVVVLSEVTTIRDCLFEPSRSDASSTNREDDRR